MKRIIASLMVVIAFAGLFGHAHAQSFKEAWQALPKEKRATMLDDYYRQWQNNTKASWEDWVKEGKVIQEMDHWHQEPMLLEKPGQGPGYTDMWDWSDPNMQGPLGMRKDTFYFVLCVLAGIAALWFVNKLKRRATGLMVMLALGGVAASAHGQHYYRELTKEEKQRITDQRAIRALKELAAQKKQEEPEEREFQEWQTNLREQRSPFNAGIEDDEGPSPFQGIKNWFNRTVENTTSTLSNAASTNAAAGDGIAGGLSKAWGEFTSGFQMVLFFALFGSALWLMTYVKNMLKS